MKVVIVAFVIAVLIGVNGVSAVPIIVDHNAVDDFENGLIPSYWIDEAKKLFISFPGESHSSGLPNGLDDLEALDNTYNVERLDISESDQHLRFRNSMNPGTGWKAAGEEDTWTHAGALSDVQGYFDWVVTQGTNLDGFGFGWCWDMCAGSGGCNVNGWAGRAYTNYAKTTYIDYWDLSTTTPNLNDYLNGWDNLDQNNPNGVLIYTTGPVDGSCAGSSCVAYQRYLKHEAIRDWVANGQDRVLFDYADILNHDNSGICEESWTDTTGMFGTHGQIYTYPVICNDNAVPEDSGHISQEGQMRLAKAFWWLAARMAGWSGPDDPECDSPTGICYYVATDGSDTTGDGNYDTPWATISHAAATVPATGGFNIIVKDGIYDGNNYIERQFQDWVTIKSENRYKAVLTNTVPIAPQWDAALVIRGYPGKSNVVVEGFEMTNEYTGYTCVSRNTFVVLFTNMSNIILRDNILHGNDAPNTCNDLIKVNRWGGGCPGNISITGNVIYDPASLGGDDLLDVMFICDINVSDNVFFSTGSPQSQSFITIKREVYAGHPDLPSDVRNPRFVVNRNVFLNWDGKTDQVFMQFGEDGDSEFMITNSLIENNLFIGNTPNVMSGPVQLKGTANITVRANTMVGDYQGSRHGARIGTEGSNPPTENLYFFNNIFSDPTGTMGNELIGGYGSLITSTFVIDNNLYWNNGNSLPSSGILTPVDDVNSFEGDPLLEIDHSGIVLPVWDNVTHQFPSGSTTVREEFERLVNTYGVIGESSLAVGNADPSNMPADDILGNMRDSSPDIGAFEYISASGDSDVNSDSVVNIIDLVLVIFNQGRSQVGEGPNWIHYDHLDVNDDNSININDIFAVIGSF